MSRNGFDGKERRAYFRLDGALKVHLRLSGSNPAKTYTATTKNISHGGLCVEVSHHQKELIEKLCADREDSELNLEATIRTNALDIVAEPAWIKCKLDWAKQSATKDPALTMGLTFKNLAENTRKQIREYIIEEFVKCYGKTDRD
jgi:c-di-GMP-binding flagellar brake protein YcgR